MAVDMHIDCMVDGTVAAYVYVAAVDADLLVDSGTYTVEEVYKYTFNSKQRAKFRANLILPQQLTPALKSTCRTRPTVVANFQR